MLYQAHILTPSGYRALNWLSLPIFIRACLRELKEMSDDENMEVELEIRYHGTNYKIVGSKSP